MDIKKVVIVGGGIAGYSVAKGLCNQENKDIYFFTKERHMPYRRPSVNKDVFTKDKTIEQISFPITQDMLNSVNFYIGEQVNSVDLDDRRIVTEKRIMDYDYLVLATGSFSRELNLPWISNNKEKVYYIRTFDDAIFLKNKISSYKTGGKVTIIGAGILGLELASSIVYTFGIKKVEILEKDKRVCSRVLSPLASDWLYKLHNFNGVDIKFGLTEYEINSHLETNYSDIVIVSIGTIPNISLVEHSIKVDRGIIVDNQGKTSNNSVWAAGDCVSLLRDGIFWSPEDDTSARRLGDLVAKSIINNKIEESFFDFPVRGWSNQYGILINFIGLTSFSDDNHIEKIIVNKDNELIIFIIEKSSKKIVGVITAGMGSLIRKSHNAIGLTQDQVDFSTI